MRSSFLLCEFIEECVLISCAADGPTLNAGLVAL